MNGAAYGGPGDLESGPRASSASPLVHLALEGVRRGFVRKVYGLVAIQLGVTALLAAPITSAEDVWLEQYSALLFASTLGFVVLAASLVFCRSIWHQHPWNLLILGLFTGLESVSVGFICATYELQSVLWCISVSSAVVATLTAVACFSKIDVTGFGVYLRTASLSIFFLGLAGFCIGAPLLKLIYSIAGALLFAAYVIYDTQLVVGGKHQEKRFGVDDYVLAALSIYMDIVRLFLFILRLFGEQRRSRR